MNKNLVIFFSDIVGSTTIYEQQGDLSAERLISNCVKDMIAEVERNKGTLIKTVGDEVMAYFPNADLALHAAVSIQLLQQNLSVKVRIGFHYGVVVEKNGDYFGNAVNIAARIASRATANEIMTTEQTVKLLSHSNRKNVRFLSNSTVKGKDEILSIYEVLWDPEPEDGLTIMAPPPFTPIDTLGIELELVYQARVFRINSTNLTLSIGRSNENNITVNDELASRRHAKIELKNSRFILTDTSTNGTFVIIGNNPSIKVVRESIELVGSGRVELGKHKKENSENIIYKRVNLQ